MPEHPLPALPGSSYERSVLGFLNEAIREGEAFLKEEPGFDDIPEYLRYLQKGSAGPGKEYVAHFQIGRAKKALFENIAALTDLKETFGFRSANPTYEGQAQIINKLIKAWWLQQDIDVRTGEVISWAAVAGSGYGIVQMQGDDIVLESIDTRDVLPLRPSSRNNIEDCLGVLIRSVISVNHAKQLWPAKAHLIQPSYEGSFHQSRIRRLGAAFRTALDRLTSSASTQDMNVPMVEVWTLQVKDAAVNPTGGPIVMGPQDKDGNPGTNWSYLVGPGQPLYPRKRWIVATRDVILSDGPGPYWHGRFTPAKLTLDPLVGSWLGDSQLRALIPLNNLLEELTSGIVQTARKNLRPGMVADKHALPESVFKALDMARPNMKLAVNPVLGDAVKFMEQVQLPNFIIELVRWCVEQIDDLAGTRGLQELLTLKQMPGADTLEKLQSALTPLIKRRGRMLEVYMRHIAEMVKYNIFQFYNAERRFQILGPDGLTIEDFDYEPGMLKPSGMSPEQHVKNFSFYVVPNSLLDLAQVERKLLYLMLRRAGEIDHRTFLEVLDIPNIDQIDQRLSSEIDQKIAMAAGLSPQTGRPPTAQEMPHLEQKEGGRPVVAES